VKRVPLVWLLLLAIFPFGAVFADEFPAVSLPKSPEASVAVVQTAEARHAVESGWTLDRLVREAIDSHPETLARRASLEAAEASADAALQQFFPKPYTQLQQLGGRDGYGEDRRKAVVGISQPLWTGGKLTAELDVARSSALSAEYSVTETKLSLANRVVDAYQGLVQFRGRLRAQEKHVQLLEQYDGTIKRRVQSGVSARSDQEQLDSRLSQARSDLAYYSASLQTLMVRLNQLVGRPVEAADIAYTAVEPLAELPEPDALVEKALRINPTLHRVLEERKALEYQEDQQRSALMPTLSVKVEHSDEYFLQRATKGVLGEENLIYLSLEASPGAGLSALSNIEAAKAKTRNAQQIGEAYRRELTAKVYGDYTDYQSSSVRRRLFEQNVRTSKEVLESYSRMFIVGKRSWLDVLNAARELTQGEISVADTLSLNQASAYRLRLHAGDMEWLRLRKEEDKQ
jgi:adhesin transport system outer membrane protein